MASVQDEDMYLFQGDIDSTPNAFAGQAFDSFLDTAALAQDDNIDPAEFLNTQDPIAKREHGNNPSNNLSFTRESTSSSSSSSDSDSAQYHNRNVSSTTTNSSHNSKSNAWSTGINGYPMPSVDQYYDDTSMSGLEQDFEVANQQMASAFDFDTAASTPSGFDAASLNGPRMGLSTQPMRHPAGAMNMNNRRSNSPHITGAPAQFYLGSRETSPLGTMLPTSSAPSPWNKHSPSSGLEENFNHMVMNGDSPGNATFSPGMHMNFGPASFTFGGDSNTTTPSSFAKDISSPPSTIHSSESHPVLHIYPTSLKSRVETQIPIKMTLHPLPSGVKKLRLPTYTVSKPKFLAKPEVDRSPDILELHTSLVCTSAMQDPVRKQRALARARGEDLSQHTRPSPASSSVSSHSRDDDEKPLNGGEVKICTGCIQRERKRASRKKQKKPEEEELFQKDEEKRVVVFNTNEIKEWAEATRENLPASESTPPPVLGAMQVELPMRIACYCRHQNEKLGFMVIFTIKDYRDRVVAQAMTNSIMITDDHKTHNAPPSLAGGHMSQMSPVGGFPSSAMFTGNGIEFAQPDPHTNKMFKQSYSTPDLTRLQHPFNGQFTGAGNAPFAIPSAISGNSSATLTPKNLSRPASPSGPTGPATKRRKPSGSGKLPSGLTMTRLDTTAAFSNAPATMPNTAASSPYATGMSFVPGSERQFQPQSRPQGFGHSPPTPNGTEGGFPTSINRSFSLENLPRQVTLMSAPSSRQPSRPGSPGPDSGHNGFGQPDSALTQAVSQQLMNQGQSRRPVPVIHKVVPAEGSVSGGTEVTLLGNGFYQGLEVMFGDTEATTTTFWGEKCLNCIAPPAVHPGVVPVVFKHEHPLYATMHGGSHFRHSIFTYTDDREIELLRLALRTIGKSMGTDDPNVAAQQVLQQSQMQNGGNMFPQSGGYNVPNGHQRAVQDSYDGNLRELENDLIAMLSFARRQAGWAPLQLILRRPSGLTMLHLAASLNMIRLTRALSVCGADLDVLDNNGFTPMHHAAMNGHDETISILRLFGADHRVRSVRNFIPADLATTLQAYQATMRPYHTSHSSGAGGLQLYSLSRNNSSRSLSSFWDTASVPFTDTDSDDGEEREPFAKSIVRSASTTPSRLPFVRPNPVLPMRSLPPSRRGSRQMEPLNPSVEKSASTDNTESTSALTNVWRQFVNLTQAQQLQLAEQLQHLQESAQWALPNFSNLPLPDYQNTNVMRRVSALFPQRPTSPQNGRTPLVESWWDSFKRSSSPASAPPSYDELYPGETREVSKTDVEKSSAMIAAVDAAMDNHYTAKENLSGSKSVYADRSNTLRTSAPTAHRPERVGLMQDRKLFLFWIPLLAIMIALIIRNTFVWDFTTAVPAMVAEEVQAV